VCAWRPKTKPWTSASASELKENGGRVNTSSNLILSGVQDEELAEAIKAIHRAEQEIRQEGWEAGLETDFDYGEERFRLWCEEQGIDPESLTEDKIRLINEEIHRRRSQQ